MLAIALGALISAATLVASEDWRGNNRLAGSVVDKSNGKPVAGAKLKLRIQKGEKGGPDVTSDGNGRWAILGISYGSWNIDVEAPGYDLRQIGPIQLAEGQRLPPIKIELDPHAAPAPVAAEAPAEPAHEEVKIGGVAVSKDVADAVEAGNRFITEQKYKEAVAEFEKAYPTLSSNISLKIALARAYYGAGDLKKAIVLLDEAYKANPADAPVAMLLANMLIEDGQTDRGKEVIEKLPTGSITDPTIYINMGIAAMNKKQPGVAVEYFTKAIGLDDKRHEGYYYRGLASLQMGKTKQAKPDLEKVVQLAPESAEAKDAKEYLKSIK
ncbi:MAG: tetratricopeptide repeat protein [Acidobacteriota bacterium]